MLEDEKDSHIHIKIKNTFPLCPLVNVTLPTKSQGTNHKIDGKTGHKVISKQPQRAGFKNLKKKPKSIPAHQYSKGLGLLLKEILNTNVLMEEKKKEKKNL